MSTDLYGLDKDHAGAAAAAQKAKLGWTPKPGKVVVKRWVNGVLQGAAPKLPKAPAVPRPKTPAVLAKALETYYACKTADFTPTVVTIGGKQRHKHRPDIGARPSFHHSYAGRRYDGGAAANNEMYHQHSRPGGRYVKGVWEWY